MKTKILLSRALLGLSIALSIASVSAADQFKNAKDIPAPSRVNLNAPLNTAVNNNQQAQQSYMTLGKNSLSQPSLLTQPIKLDEVSLKQQTVTISNDDSHLINVSQSLANRISTPFHSPTVLSNGGISFQIIGQDVFFEMKSDSPVGVYIREDESIQNHSPVASLTLIPKAIPSQNISVVLDKNIKSSAASPRVKIASDYEDGLITALGQAVLNNTPDGFSRSNATKLAVAKIGGVLLRPTTIYSGVDQNIYVYSAENTTNQSVELVEPSFHHEGVRAIAFFPEIRLEPRDKTNVYIMSDVGEPSFSD
jgi:conjugal transfer pilus assembly protein TraK